MILDEILAKTKADLVKAKEITPHKMLENGLKSSFLPRNVSEILAKNSVNIIAEIKKASPSKGVIRENFNPLKIAAEYENAGVSAFSILTESHFFQGDLEFLTQIRRLFKTPILRKDFIIDPYQIAQARVFGADFILLIAKALDLASLKNLYNYAKSVDLEVLFEIHDEGDLEKALACNAEIIGINHRKLEDFSMDMNLCEKLIPQIPKGKIIVAESGIKTHADVVRLRNLGVNAFLIGEHFMRQSNIKAAVKSIKGEL